MTDLLAPYASSAMQRDVIVASVLFALVAHQAFRRYETYSVSVHASLLLLPPALAVGCVLSAAGQWSAWSFVDALPLSFAVYAVALASSVVLYRLSPFHPLARYPGPLGCKVTGFWIAFKALSGHQRDYVKSLHQLYGDVVRIGPNNLSICDPSLLPSLLGASGVPKGPHFKGRLVSENISLTIGIQDPEQHSLRRRAWARGFTPTAVKGYEEQIAARVRQLVGRLEEQGGQARLDDWFGYFTLDFVADIAFGGGSELLNSTEKKNLWSVLDETLGFSTFLGHVPWFGVYLGHIPFLNKGTRGLMAYCRGLARNRIERGTVKRDLFYYLNHEDITDAERAPPSIQQVVDDGILAIIAGSDTVASGLTSLFSCLLAHPEAYKKLQAEVDQFCPSLEDALDAKRHREMKYLDAVINETLRLLTPAPFCTQRQVPRDGTGVMAGSTYIPPGTTFWVHAWTMQRDARNFFPAPEGFWPERWLIASGHRGDKHDAPGVQTKGGTGGAPEYDPATFMHNEAAFVPFSAGPMNCVGKNLALQEMRTVVCALVQRFKMQPQREKWAMSEYEAEYRDYFLTTRPRVPVVLEERRQGYE